MAKPPIWDVHVASSTVLTPNMRRIELTGDALAGFPQGQEGGYVKLLLPKGPLGPEVTAETADPADFVRRSYTVRSFDAERRILALHFAGHTPRGPASVWAEEARAGDRVLLAGPGPVKMLNPEADWVFVVGDMAALPAIQCNLERLSKSAVGYVVVAANSAEDHALPEELPAGIEVHWVEDAPAAEGCPLMQRVRSLPWRDGAVSVWSATEFGGMKLLRDYFKGERGVPKEAIYISSYWKRGATDEQHKAAKKEAANKEGGAR